MAERIDLTSSARRLVSLLEEENSHILARNYSALPGLTEQKSRLLFEITKSIRSAPSTEWLCDRESISEMQEALRKNERTLRVHLQAAQALGAIIRDHLSEEASDGTYLPTLRRSPV